MSNRSVFSCNTSMGSITFVIFHQCIVQRITLIFRWCCARIIAFIVFPRYFDPWITLSFSLWPLSSFVVFLLHFFNVIRVILFLMLAFYSFVLWRIFFLLQITFEQFSIYCYENVTKIYSWHDQNLSNIHISTFCEKIKHTIIFCSFYRVYLFMKITYMYWESFQLNFYL